MFLGVTLRENHKKTAFYFSIGMNKTNSLDEVKVVIERELTKKSLFKINSPIWCRSVVVIKLHSVKLKSICTCSNPVCGVS